jgi:hypothetical protein
MIIIIIIKENRKEATVKELKQRDKMNVEPKM